MKIICKERLEIANHTRREVYSLGRIYLHESTLYSLEPVTGKGQIDYEKCHIILSRLLVAMRGDDISLYVDDSANDPLYFDEYEFFPWWIICEKIDEIVSKLSEGKDGEPVEDYIAGKW